ncbi:hypothetical protein [Burkholderia sp. BCC0398]|uniref:hypothetical protein n=1 Tax=Burkholderia sp. BCC0398 TaxID=2676297 RepID=UPI000F593627|nr:hypothetical protein [Burkholderia sp. BCC0398]
MPTKIDLGRTMEDDMATLQTFIDERQMNWQIVRENLRLLKNEYQNYRDDFASCKRYRVLEPRRFLRCSTGLRKLYDQTPKCLDHINEFRRRASRTLSVCPYCGMPMARITLDHYLPRDIRAFPHLSILSSNLVPACDACQSSKGNSSPLLRRLVNKNERRRKTMRMRVKRTEIVRNSVNKRFESRFQRRVSRFLHPYFDDFVSDIIWKLNPSGNGDPLKTLKLVPVDIDPRKAALVRYQIDKLGLQARVNDEISRWVRFSVRVFQYKNVMTIADARTVAGLLLDAYWDKDLTPNGMACTFFRALREHTVVADAVIGLATAAIPTRTMRSRAVKL